MLRVNVLEAKADVSKLIRLIESNRDDENRITRDGKPFVINTAIDKKPVSKRIGVAKGEFIMPDDFDALTTKNVFQKSESLYAHSSTLLLLPTGSIFLSFFSSAEEKTHIIKRPQQ